MIKVVVLVLALVASHVWSSATIGDSDQVHYCIEKERQALLSLKQRFVDNDNTLFSWTSTRRDCCAWSGIRCDNLTHHVTSLDLSFKGLGGEIGHSLVDLQYLRYLDLGFNEFTKIPEFIGSLTRLISLDFYLNPIMSIPSQLGNLTRLQFLHLGGTEFSYISTNLEWLSHLSSLRFLTLTYINATKSTNWLHSIEIAPSLTSIELFYCLFPPTDDHIFTYKNSSNSLTNLDISESTIPSKTIPWLLNMSTNLVNLTFRENKIEGPRPLPNSFENMRSLARLDLTKNGFEGELPKSLRNLCNLQELVLRKNNFNETICDVIGSLIGCANNLEILELSRNQFEGPLPNISTFSSYLRRLDASNNKLNGTMPEGIGELQQLEYLDLYSNSFSGTLPKSIGKLQQLKELDLSSNSFTSALPKSIGKLQQLKYLYLYSNSFSGLVTEVHFQNLSKLKILDLSDNSLTLRINSTWIPPFQLDILSLRSCKSGPQFPTWLKTQIIISTLDLSNSEIHDEIPNWFFSQTLTLDFLNLSSNHFRGPIPPYLSNVEALILSNNRFINLKTFLCYPIHGSIRLLDISNNMLNGSLPDCLWNTKDLIVLKLDNNNLSGVIPRTIGLLSKIQHLLLGHNNFSGNLPSPLKNCTKLEVLDVESNNLEGNIPFWIGERLTNLILLRIRSNNFYGIIPSNLCHLQFVQIFDISINAISGYIPSCIKSFTSMVAKGNQFDDERDIGTMAGVVWFDVIISIMWKGILREYSSTLGLLRVIDLSSNKLTGKIPKEMFNLVQLVQLNLSRNDLNGTIPMEIGNLTKLDSLDLSHNKLCGVIPTSLASISSLSFLDLSNNKLSGRIPTGTQLQSFDASMYIDNDGLCGPPLTKSCVGDESPNGSRDHSGGTEGSFNDEEEWFDMSWFHMGTGVGFGIGFAGVCGNLLLNASWRRNYFHYMGTIGDWLYVTISIKTNLLKRRFLN
ncbi:receptor-like protein EIX2 [Humulus lupulus]|uniref:receptor-like protein EIX2 n=1 Tax=Humulus lupulus TaxID=3486 RepID=UPI002B4153BE|nr:receptor-like protein EIX2 [Humulus lupulus]